MHAAFLDFATMGPDLDLAPLRRPFERFDIHDDTRGEQLGDRIRDVEFVFTNKFRMHREQLALAPALRFIGLTATGTDNIDLEAAAGRGIAVCNIRDYCTSSVVEHVFGVMLMLTHSLPQYTASVSAGEWQQSTSFCMLTHPIPGLAGRTLGIVGHGALGRGVATAARAFGMHVLLAARPGEAPREGRVPLDELLADCDVVSLHCPLTAATRGLIGAGELARMKPGSVLINTARGALVDSAALIDALRDGRIGGAAIDVLSKEPPVDGDPLLDYRAPNLIVTPHIAWAADASRQNAVHELARNVEAFLKGERRNRIV